MPAHRYHNPVHSVFGAGALSSLPELLAGRRAALITFPEARAIGLLDQVQALLGRQLTMVIDQVHPNPDVAELAATYDAFWREQRDTEVIVALGGGSTIDTAKALMVGTHSGSFTELMSLLEPGRPFQPAQVKSLIAIPTTAGTGSEVTPWATIWERARHKKHSLQLARTWAQYAIVDPQLMLSLPASVTLQSGLDALSHALESIWNVNANPVSDTFAVAAIVSILDTLPALLREPGSLALRERMALAALQAGLAFSNTKTALAHSISYEMTLRHGLPHGIACSFTLPMVLRMALGQSAERDEVLRRALGDPLEQAPQRLAGFIEGLGVKTDFAAYGVGAAEAERMVREAGGSARGRNFIGAAPLADSIAS